MDLRCVDHEELVIKLERENEKLRSRNEKARTKENDDGYSVAFIENLQKEREEAAGRNASLELDIERLKDEISEMELSLRNANDAKDNAERGKLALEEQKKKLEKENRKLREQQEDTVNQRHARMMDESAKDSANSKLIEEAERLEKELKETQGQLHEVVMHFEHQSKQLENAQADLTEKETQEQAYKNDIKSLESELEEKNRLNEEEMEDLNKQLAALRNAVKENEDDLRRKERAITKLKADNDALSSDDIIQKKDAKFKTLSSQHEQLRKDYDGISTAYSKLNEDFKELKEHYKSDKADVELQVEEAMKRERVEMRKVEKLNNNMAEELKNKKKEMMDINEENSRLHREVTQLQAEIVEYQAGKGWEQLGRTNARLRQDLARVTRDRDRLTDDISNIRDDNGKYHTAFERLAREAGKPEGFEYPDYIIKEEQKVGTARLSGIITMLNKQIQQLEENNSKLRRAQTEQIIAGKMSSGVTVDADGNPTVDFGLEPDAMAKVIEYVENLKMGKDIAPSMSTSPSELAFKEEVRIISESSDGSNQKSIAMISSMEKMMQSAKDENMKLRNQMNTMEKELYKRFRDQAGHSLTHTESISQVMKAHNDALLLEIKTLKEQAQVGGTREVIHQYHTVREDKPPVKEAAPESHQAPPGVSFESSGGADNKTGTTMAATPQPHATNAAGGDNLPPKSVLKNTTATPANAYMNTPQGHPGMMYYQGGAPMTGTPFGYPPAGMTQSMALATPRTPAGQYAWEKKNATLPPEEWADEVKEINGQLIECLEQLQEREQELVAQHELTSNLEETLLQIKQQMAALYHDFAIRSDAWENKKKELEDEAREQRNAKEDLEKQFVMAKQSLDSIRADLKPDDLKGKLSEALHKTSILTKNESVLSRKYISLQEQFEAERNAKLQLEDDFAEMETSLKYRILYLEQYKQSASSRLALLDTKLLASVPVEHAESLKEELNALRVQHLELMEEKVEDRKQIVDSKTKISELRILKQQHASTEIELSRCKAMVDSLTSQVEQEQLTCQSIMSSKSVEADMASFITDLAQERGKTGKLEVEWMTATKRASSFAEQVKMLSKEVEVSHYSIDELQRKQEDLISKERAARVALQDVTNKYTHGLDRDAASALRKQVDKMEATIEQQKAEVAKYKSMSETAANHAQHMAQSRSNAKNEIEDLKNVISTLSELEAKSQDHLLVGRLQRQLITTKTSYQAFVSKYKNLLVGLHTRERKLRDMEFLLDRREKHFLELQKANRQEISALKKALRDVQNLSEVDPFLNNTDSASAATASLVEAKKVLNRSLGFIPIGNKITKLTSKVKMLSEKAEVAVAKSKKLDEEARQLEDKCETYRIQLDASVQKCRDITAINKGLTDDTSRLQAQLEGKSPSKANKNKLNTDTARRLILLSDEIRDIKIKSVQQHREIQVLKEEKRHLQSLLKQSESDMDAYHASKINEEADGIIGTYADGGDKGHLRASIGSTGGGEDVDLTKLPSLKKNLTVNTSTEFNANNKSALTVEELLGRLEKVNNELNDAQRETSNYKLQYDKAMSTMSSLESQLLEKNSELQYYTRMAQQENLPLMNGANNNNGHGRSDNMSANQYKMMKQEQEKLTEASRLTLQSMKSIMEEKDRRIARLEEDKRDLMNEATVSRKSKSRATRNADALLEQLDEDEKRGPKVISKVDGQSLFADDGGMGEQGKRLMEQIEKLSDDVEDRNGQISALNAKLAEVWNRYEAAESRCGEQILEIQRCRQDFVFMKNELLKKEERLRRLQGKPALTPNEPIPFEDAKIMELTKKLNTSAKRCQDYKTIILGFKDKLQEVEEARAMELLSKGSDKENAVNRRSQEASAVSTEELKDMQSQITSLRNGLRQAKEDAEKSKQQRERLASARKKAQEEVERLETQVGRSESQAASTQQSLMRTRKELEESRKKEARLRDKLKELLESEGGADKLKDLKASVARADKFEKDVEILRAQNLALRRAAEEASQEKLKGNTGGGSMIKEFPKDLGTTAGTGGTGLSSSPSGRADTFGGTSNTLGQGPPQDELRQQLHSRWEQEKKLQKRITIMEKRLQEKMEENEDLTNQLKRAREMAQQAMHSKEEYSKKLQSSQKQAAEKGKHSSDDNQLLNDANSRIFDLEEKCAVLKRRAEVEQINEINKLHHQIANQQAQISNLSAELEESEVRRKTSAAGGLGDLRESEDRHHRVEKMRDNLDQARRQKVELEAAILDRDAKAIENRFDLEAKDLEVERLRKRIKDLENAYKSTSSSLAGTVGKGKDSSLKGSAASRQLEEQNNTIATLKRVAEKYKSENDKLKRDSDRGRKDAGMEKKYAAEKKKAEDLQAQIDGNKAKLKAAEDAQRKLVQQREHVQQLRKQLRKNEDELNSYKETAGSGSNEIDALHRKYCHHTQTYGKIIMTIHYLNHTNLFLYSFTSFNMYPYDRSIEKRSRHDHASRIQFTAIISQSHWHWS